MNSQHPCHPTVQLYINTLQIRQGHLLLEYHLVEANDEVGIQETSMEDTKTKASSNEFEVIQMLRVNARCRVNLKGVIVVGRVFKETIEGVEHFMREEEEKLSESG